MQQSMLLAVKEARESAKSEQIARLMVEHETLLTLGTATLILLITQCTNYVKVLKSKMNSRYLMHHQWYW